MQRLHARLRCPTALAAMMILALGAGCVGQISGPGGFVGASSGSAATGGTGAGASGAAGGTGAAPTLSEVALRYFPGQAVQNAPARVVRLTRTQLDLTTRSLLSKVAIDSALTALPSDPLQT